MRFACLFTSVFVVGPLVCPLLAQGPPRDMPPAPVRVEAAQQRELDLGETFVGTIGPRRTSVVGSLVSGRVEQFLVNEGDVVEAGQALAELRKTAVEIELAGAKAELELRQQELTELENGSRPEEIEQAEARRLAAQALVRLMESRLKRTQALFDRNVATEDELQEQISAAETAQQTLLEREAALELARQGPRQEAIAQARAKMLMQQEAMRRLEDDLEQHTIRAPFDGLVSAEHTEEGQWLSQGGPVCEIVDLVQVDVEAPLLESYLPRLAKNAPAQVRVGAYPDRTWTGAVALVVPTADIRSRSFPVKVRLDNERNELGYLLKPGMFARVTLPVGGRGPAVLVPKDALVLGGDSIMIWIVTPDPQKPDQGSVRPAPVELGVADGEWIAVRGPVQPGQLVVVEGDERINPTRPVQMLPPAGAAPARPAQ